MFFLFHSFFVGVHGFKGSEVQGSIFVPGLHLERVFIRKSAIFDRPNPIFGAKFAITLENDHVQRRLWVFNAFFALNPER